MVSFGRTRNLKSLLSAALIAAGQYFFPTRTNVGKCQLVVSLMHLLTFPVQIIQQ